MCGERQGMRSFEAVEGSMHMGTRETLIKMVASGSATYIDESELPKIFAKHGSRSSMWRKTFADIPSGKALVIEAPQIRLRSITSQLRYFHNHNEFPNLTARQATTDKTRLYIINHALNKIK
jgi:hypothetical protein